MFGNCVSNPKAAAELKRKKKKQKTREGGEKKLEEKLFMYSCTNTYSCGAHTFFSDNAS